MTEATSTLIATLDMSDLLDRLAGLCVPLLADWVFLTLVDEQGNAAATGELAHGPRVFLAMELCPGRDLRAWIDARTGKAERGNRRALTRDLPGDVSRLAARLRNRPLRLLAERVIESFHIRANDTFSIAFKQAIAANEPRRTGSYSKTLTFTLSTTNP